MPLHGRKKRVTKKKIKKARENVHEGVRNITFLGLLGGSR